MEADIPPWDEARMIASILAGNVEGYHELIRPNEHSVYRMAPAVAAAREPTPISRRTPLKAMNAVHALCRSMKQKLVKPMSQERLADVA